MVFKGSKKKYFVNDLPVGPSDLPCYCGGTLILKGDDGLSKTIANSVKHCAGGIRIEPSEIELLSTKVSR